MAAHIHIRVLKYIGVFRHFDNGDPFGQVISQNLIHRHSHVVAGLSRAQEIDVAFLGEIPGLGSDMESGTFHVHNALDSLGGIQPLEGFLGDIQDDLSGRYIPVGGKCVVVTNFLHSTIPIS